MAVLVSTKPEPGEGASPVKRRGVTLAVLTAYPWFTQHRSDAFTQPCCVSSSAICETRLLKFSNHFSENSHMLC